MSFVSVPKKPELPDEPFYGIEQLFLFDRHNRMTWEQTFGEQAWPWDKERRIKRWADTSALEGVEDPDTQMVEYDYFDMASRSFKKFKITARDAALPNLPGTFVYPKYTVGPTPAVVVNDEDGVGQPLNPRTICYKQEAEAVVRELGSAELVEALSFTSGPFRIEWNGEQRRRWLIKFDSKYHSAAALVQARNREGVGSPGEWIITGPGPFWVSYAQDTGDRDPRPEIPMPCRLLLEQEELYLRHPMSVIVYRKDMESEFNQPSPVGLSDASVEILRRIDANVQQLLALGITG